MLLGLALVGHGIRVRICVRVWRCWDWRLGLLCRSCLAAGFGLVLGFGVVGLGVGVWLVVRGLE